MSPFSRAASFAAVTFAAGLLIGSNTPGFAQEVHRAPIAAFNAITQTEVPAETTNEPIVSDDGAVPTAELKPAVVQDMTGDDEDYDTLHEAVAAQDAAIDDRELSCLASGVFYESNGEPLAGQLAVAHTILNRTKSGRFPKSICGVLTQRGQFSFVRGGAVPTAEGRRGWNTAVAVAKVALDDLWDSAAPEALFFHARRVSPGWRMTRVGTVGNHVFYR